MREQPSLSILIVEDDPLIADLLKRFLIRLNYKNVRIALTDADALELLETAPPDLAFLDIQLNGAPRGLHVASVCGKKEIPFVFLTSQEDPETISAAARLKPAAYLIKPFSKNEIAATMQVAVETALKPTSMSIKDGIKSVRVNPNEIDWIEAKTPYITIHSQSGIVTIRSSLKDMLAELPANMFIQIHRSYAVNREKITQMTRTEVTLGDKRLPISRSFKDKIAEIKRT